MDVFLAPLPRRPAVGRLAGSAEAFEKRVSRRSHAQGGTLRFKARAVFHPWTPVENRLDPGSRLISRRFWTPVDDAERPPGGPRGRVAGGVAAYFAAMRSKARRKKRARPVMRRTILPA